MLVGHTLADQNGRLLAADARVCEILQREHDDLIGSSFETFTYSEDLERNRNTLAGVEAGEGPTTIRKRYVRQDGSCVWANVLVSKIEESGSVRFIATIEVIDAAHLRTYPYNLWRAAVAADKIIRKRRDELGLELFGDHVWFLLLQIYVSEAEGRAVSLRDLCASVDMSLQTLKRWCSVLEQRTLIRPSAHAGQPPKLTSLGLRKIKTILEH